MAQSPTTSRVFDAYLDSDTIGIPAKRKVVLAFIGHFHVLVDDRIGSRVGDHFWDFSDTYLKVCAWFIDHNHLSRFGPEKNCNVIVVSRANFAGFVFRQVLCQETESVFAQDKAG
jgi:hypothetical protein